MWSYQRLDDLEFLTYSLKGIQRFREFRISMKSRDNSTHATLIGRYCGEHDTLREDSLLEETIAELHCQGAFAHYYGRNWRLAMPCIEAELLQATFEEGSILPEALDKAIVFL